MPMRIFPLPLHFNFNGLLMFFVRPFMLAFYIWVILLFFLPDYFQEYKAEVVETEYTSENNKIYYHDIDGDGICERLAVRYNTENVFPGILYLDLHENIIDQWNFRGKWLLNQRLFFGDYNHNGIKEVYVFTRVADSIFLNAKELMLENGLVFTNRYICKSGIFNLDKVDVLEVGGIMMDIDKNGKDEFVFSLYSGLSKQPRNSFAYYITNDSLASSPQSAAGFNSNINYLDINHDEVKEITGTVFGPENIHTNMPYTDSCSWLMVISPKDSMHFLFPPIKFDGGIGCGVRPVLYSVDNKKYIAAIFESRSTKKGDGYSYLKLFDHKGSFLRQKKLQIDTHKSPGFFNLLISQQNDFKLVDEMGNIYSVDTLLNIVKTKENDSDLLGVDMFSYYMFDIDNDGEKEILFLGRNTQTNKLVIYRADDRYPVIVSLPESKPILHKHACLKTMGTTVAPILVLQADNVVYHIKYEESRFWLLKYPTYLAGYIVLFLLFWLLQQVQNKLAQRKFATERQLMKQQLTISIRQLEPHFMLNTLNNIGYMFSKENKDDAQYYFGRFASLIHRGLKYADQVETTLNEELEFVKDYLILQKRRFNGDLDFTIESDFEIEPSKIKIPHSLIFTFVENAIKHGLMHKMSDRKLSIQVARISKQIQVIITDNGIGRKQSKVLNTRGTGKGLGIVAKIVEGYNKLNNRSISYKVKDLVGENGECVGTEVIVAL